MSNPTFKPSEGKREEFRKYLEKNGVMDALTKVLVNLYEEPEKPEDALEYIRDKLAIQAGLETYNQMKEKSDELQNKVEQLEQDIEQLKLKSESTPPEADAEAAGAAEGAEPSPADQDPSAPGPEKPEAPPAEQTPPENTE